MFVHHYVMEKLIELDAGRVTRIRPDPLPSPRRRPNGLMRVVGGTLRRAGEVLESWAAPNGTPSPRSDHSCPGPKH